MKTLTAVLHATALQRTLLKAEFARRVPKIRQLWLARQVFIAANVTLRLPAQMEASALHAHLEHSNHRQGQRCVKTVPPVRLTEVVSWYETLRIAHAEIARLENIL